MGSVLSHAPDQDDFKRACVQGDFDKAIQAVRHNRKLVDVRVCRSNGDKVLHMLARRAGDSHHMKELVQVLLEAQVHEGLTPGEAIRKAAKATDQRNHRYESSSAPASFREACAALHAHELVVQCYGQGSNTAHAGV